MEVVPLGSAGEIAVVAADVIESLVRRKPAAVLGLATGSTPLPAYQELTRRHRAGAGPSYAAVTCFNLDEYVGLPPNAAGGVHEQSYRATIARELTDGLGISPGQVNGPDPSPDGLPTAGERYEALIAAAGGIDVQFLGIGTDGHLAFNEPGSSLASRTRIKTLTAQTRKDNARFFGSPDEVPTHVLTQGLGTILQARHLLLIATGRKQGRRGGGRRGGPGLGVLPGLGAAAAPARHGAARPGRGRPPGPPRLLPRGIRGQAGLAGPVGRYACEPASSTTSAAR